jgi:dihydrofolate reductase
METIMKLTLTTFLTLDGVLQAPGGPEEDQEGAFPYGGWSFPLADEDSGKAIVDWFGNADAFLLGRKTYEIFAGYWPKVTDPDNPIASKLNALPKYVASTTLSSVEWNNSTLINDVVADVTKLKEQPGGELQVHGSGALAATLIDHDLIDEYRLMIFPVHLGTGKKLFRDGARAASLDLVSSMVTSKGVVFATYRPAGEVRLGSFADEEVSA